MLDLAHVHDDVERGDAHEAVGFGEFGRCGGDGRGEERERGAGQLVDEELEERGGRGQVHRESLKEGNVRRHELVERLVGEGVERDRDELVDVVVGEQVVEGGLVAHVLPPYTCVSACMCGERDSDRRDSDRRDSDRRDSDRLSPQDSPGLGWISFGSPAT